MSYDGPHVRHPLPGRVAAVVRACCVAALRRVRAAAFWTAVGLPWLLLALAVGGHVTSNPDLFAGLVATTVVCAVAARNHRRHPK